MHNVDLNKQFGSLHVQHWHCSGTKTLHRLIWPPAPSLWCNRLPDVRLNGPRWMLHCPCIGNPMHQVTTTTLPLKGNWHSRTTKQSKANTSSFFWQICSCVSHLSC